MHTHNDELVNYELRCWRYKWGFLVWLYNKIYRESMLESLITLCLLDAIFLFSTFLIYYRRRYQRHHQQSISVNNINILLESQFYIIEQFLLVLHLYTRLVSYLNINIIYVDKSSARRPMWDEHCILPFQKLLSVILMCVCIVATSPR